MDLFTPDHLRLIVQGLVILVLSIAVHEWGHAFVAHRLGDPTPGSQGRVTLNPAAHADPIGTLLFPGLALVTTGGLGFGWGRPVQVQPHLFSRRMSMRKGHLLVAAAGPMMNIIFGVFISLVYFALIAGGALDGQYMGALWYGDPVSQAFNFAIFLNFILAFFNLIPAPPLDGGAVLEGLLPEKYVPAFQRFAVYGPFVLMAVIFIPELRALFVAPAQWLFSTWTGLLR